MKLIKNTTAKVAGDRDMFDFRVVPNSRPVETMFIVEVESILRVKSGNTLHKQAKVLIKG
jgi:hypothetical protein